MSNGIRRVPGFNDLLGADVNGDIWTRKVKWKEEIGPWVKLKSKPSHDGYRRVRIKGHSSAILVHRLVLLAFKGPCPEGMEGCHYPDRDPSNCRPNNLVWGTHTLNRQHCIEQGTHNWAERNGMAKLTNDQVRWLRKVYKYKDKVYGATPLGKKFGMHPMNITRAVKGITYGAVQ